MQDKLQMIVIPIVEWYQMNKRLLPWRKDNDPYHVWISEIMLQQTRIEAVKEHYQVFMKELPDVESLANVSEDRLLKLWQGLGYYSRARNLKKAAEIVVEQYGGQMPKKYAELVHLPGVGEYTAGAIASICYQEKVTAIDGNVLRVISRVVGSKENVLLPETKKKVEKALQKVMPLQAGDFNEGLMELGEIICVPNGKVECRKCPIKQYCMAYQKDLVDEIPVREKQIKRKQEEKTVFIFITKDNKIAIEKRPDKGLLAGMYQFPNVEGFYAKNQVQEIIEKWNLKAHQITFLQKKKHIFTHIDWYMEVYMAKVEKENDIFLWVPQEELDTKYALPTAFAQKRQPFSCD